MKTIEKNCKKEQLEMAFIFSLQKKIDAPLTFDSTVKTKRLLSLRKEFYSKYAETDEGVHRYFFTAELIEGLKNRAGCMDRLDDFCILLFCSRSEQPCILTFSELLDIYNCCEKGGDLNISVEIESRTFKIVAYSWQGERLEKTVSKKASSKKLLH